MKKIRCQLYLPRQRRNEILKLIQKLVFLAWSKLHSVKLILFCSLWKLKRPEIRESQGQPFLFELENDFLGGSFRFVFFKRIKKEQCFFILLQNNEVFKICLVCGTYSKLGLFRRDKKTQFSMPLITLKAFLATVVQSKQNIFSPASSRFKFATVTSNVFF